MTDDKHLFGGPTYTPVNIHEEYKRANESNTTITFNLSNTMNFHELDFLKVEAHLLAPYLQIHRNRIETFIKYNLRDVRPELLAETQLFINEITEWDFSLETVALILALSPLAKAQLIDADALDTAVRDEISDAVAVFFLGERWPMGGDNFDIQRFTLMIQQQAQHLDIGNKP